MNVFPADAPHSPWRRVIAAAGLLVMAGIPGAAAQDTGEAGAPISLFPPTVGSESPAAGAQPPEAAEFSDIEVDRLGELPLDSLGILDVANGGLGAEAWAGSRRATVERLLDDLPADVASPTLRRLAARLLLTSAVAPGRSTEAAPTVADALAGADSADFLRRRAERLYDLGELAGLNRLLGRVPQRVEDPWLARARVDGLLLAGRDGEACGQVGDGLARFPQEFYWTKAQVYCQFIAEQTDQALLGLDLLREQAADGDAGFFAAANLFIGGTAEGLDSDGLSPLTLAMLRRSGGGLPPDAVETAPPPLLHGIAGLGGGDHAVRAAAVERLVEIGALPGERLAGAYGAFEFTEADLADALSEADRAGGVLARALLYRAANREGLAATRAEILRAAFLSADQDGRATAMARAVLPLMGELPPTAELAWFAPLAARTLYRAGQYERAGAWLSVLRSDGQRHPESQEAYVRLRPLMRLAGGSEPLALDADAVGNPQAAERALLHFVLSRALGQAEDFALFDAAGAGSAQPLERLPQLLALGDAAAAQRRGETVLLTLVSLGPATLHDSHPLALGYAVSALNAVGLGTDARALAIEAALAAGL